MGPQECNVLGWAFVTTAAAPAPAAQVQSTTAQFSPKDNSSYCITWLSFALQSYRRVWTQYGPMMWCCCCCCLYWAGIVHTALPCESALPIVVAVMKSLLSQSGLSYKTGNTVGRTYRHRQTYKRTD